MILFINPWFSSSMLHSIRQCFIQFIDFSFCLPLLHSLHQYFLLFISTSFNASTLDSIYQCFILLSNCIFVHQSFIPVIRLHSIHKYFIMVIHMSFYSSRVHSSHQYFILFMNTQTIDPQVVDIVWLDWSSQSAQPPSSLWSHRRFSISSVLTACQLSFWKCTYLFEWHSLFHAVRRMNWTKNDGTGIWKSMHSWKGQLNSFSPTLSAHIRWWSTVMLKGEPAHDWYHIPPTSSQNEFMSNFPDSKAITDRRYNWFCPNAIRWSLTTQRHQNISTHENPNRCRKQFVCSCTFGLENHLTKQITLNHRLRTHLFMRSPRSCFMIWVLKIHQITFLGTGVESCHVSEYHSCRKTSTIGIWWRFTLSLCSHRYAAVTLTHFFPDDDVANRFPRPFVTFGASNWPYKSASKA
jgi:hypothetical protein